MPSISPSSISLLLRRRLMQALAAALLPLALAACGGDDDDVVADAPPSQTTPDTPPDDTAPPDDTPTRNTAYLNAQPGDVLKVEIKELIPTQATLGYDQIYYKLGRWQGDFDRPTWQDDEENQLEYLNDTVGKKFGDYCEDTGQGDVVKFTTIEALRAATLADPSTYECEDAPGTHADAMKTVVIGWDGNLYLTDGHHSFSALREIADGGPELEVYVKVDANYSDSPDHDAFWQRMVDNKKAWLRDGDNQPITVDQLPARLGLPHDDEPGGMQDDPYRSLVYFTRDIAYDAGDLPEFAEFLWGDWLRGQVTAGQLDPLSAYDTIATASNLDAVLAKSTIKAADLSPNNSNTSYSAAVRDATLRMNTLADDDVVSGDRTAGSLGHITMLPGQDDDTPTGEARGELSDLARSDVKDNGDERGAGKLWFAAHYRACGAPRAGACWGW
ncbi:ParB/Srx family N-terminal domain-containing protein [Pigmentiphaga soli]|uniref:ParB/Srx family N-terminal domain-containing protein n=1 Tax=Pigmentiphaga soli TaxID=1007095 RepID=A0ABP8HHD1_9BURK